ncbi:MAG: PDZ domain-containing protein [Gemmatimonadota bacterium]
MRGNREKVCRRQPDPAAVCRVLMLALAGFATAAVAAAPAGSQEVRAQEECRCVDREGTVIEDCTCLRVPRGMAEMALRAVRSRQAQIGVWVEGAENAEGGALVTRVREGGPADAAGLRAGDVVVEVDGRSLSEPLEDGEAESGMMVDESRPVVRHGVPTARTTGSAPISAADGRTADGTA